MSSEKIQDIYQILKEKYGDPEDPFDRSGIEYLVETILSQNTNDVNRDKAFENLEERYGGDWQSVETADREELTDTIRIAGLGPTKAERIQKALRIVREESDGEAEEGEYSIDFLDDYSVEEAKDWLTEIPGVGAKTAAVILCFYFRKPVFPVDTHVHRLSKRWNLVPENASRTKTHEVMEEKVPDGIKYPLHRLMIQHGREECTARKDNCNCDLCRKFGREKE
ncbi:MAG: endonuclease III [Candidatus Nanohalobium sp.]